MSVLITEETTGGWYRNGSAGAWTPILTLCGFWYAAKKKVQRVNTSQSLQAYELVITGGIFLRDSAMFDTLIDSSPLAAGSSAVQLAVGYRIQGGGNRSKVKIFKGVIFAATDEAELVSWREPAKADGEWREPIRLPFIISKRAPLAFRDFVSTYDDDEWQIH